ncbi:MAG: lantibiotic dehydratase family protein [Acidobacteriia bacterium]|nr:lantibiotic dehydratase family protein [Terriglobia bacterium]
MALPAIFRVAALPVSHLEPFRNSALPEIVSRSAEVEVLLQQSRQDLVAALYKQIAATHGPTEKQALLNLKRVCSAGKQLSHSDLELPLAAGEALAGKMANVRNAELQLEKLGREFSTLYESHHAAECSALHGSFNIPELLCGVSFSSASIVDQVRRFRADGSSEPRKRRRMELAWLSYLTRTALKPSPFSTLTWVGIGLLDDSSHPGFSFDSLKRHSMVRIKRYIVDQCFQQLLAYQPFLEELEIELNYTLARAVDGGYSFLAPGKWRPNSSAQYEFKLESLANIRLPEQLAEFLQAWFARGPRGYRPTATALWRDLQMESRDDAVCLLGQLIDSGLLLPNTEWFTNAARLEAELATHLQSLHDERLLPVIAQFLDLCALEQSCAAEPQHAPSLVKKIHQKIDDVWASIQALLPEDKKARFTITYNPAKHDLFVTSEKTSFGEIISCPRESVEELYRKTAPLSEISSVFWSGYDFLHTLAALLRVDFVSQCAESNPVPLVEVLNRARPVWKEFTGYVLKGRHEPFYRAPFNPEGLESIERLHEIRGWLWQAITECQELNAAGEYEINVAKLERVAAELIPEYYRSHFPPCFFVQPAGPSMERWVFNQCADGSGRMTSRFAWLMPEELRSRYVEHVRVCSRRRQGSRQIEFLDVSTINGEMLNVHPLQCRYVLRFPGDHFDAPAEAQLQLEDLKVVLDSESGLPRLIGPRGEWILPVQLGGVGHDFISSATVRQLCVFGPAQRLPFIPEVQKQQHGKLFFAPRLVMGNLILRRMSWTVAAADLPRSVSTGEDPTFYAQMNRWRLAAGIPVRCYARLQVQFDPSFSRHKPQFIDFSSPLFLRLLASMLQNFQGQISFEEALPSPESCREGGHIYELLADPLLLRHDFPAPEEPEEVSRSPLQTACV